jgi:predicted Fe-Mo cluster-binding NifX family protein
MTIAIPLFGERVSPHFSTAPELLVVLAQEQTVFSMMRFHLATASLSEKKKKILFLGVDILVCGGIDRATQEWLQKRGIHVIANVLGEAEDVLPNLLGKLQENRAAGKLHIGPGKEKKPCKPQKPEELGGY